MADSLEALISSLRTLLDSGWHTSKRADDLRSLFIRTIMGDYLKCFHCDNCGTSFIVNKEPCYNYVANYYRCPGCHNYGGLKADDSFLKAMVSEEQQENVRRVEELQKEYDALTPFKVFFDVPCEVCKAPVTEWTEQTLKKGIKGLGWGHGRCWTTSAGQLVQLTRLLEKKWTR